MYEEVKEPVSEECTHDCSSCSLNCSSKEQGEKKPKSFLKEAHPQSNIKKVIAVVSGKGGVGKSLVTSLMATEMKRRGHASAIMDADITGPSIPNAFGLYERAMGNEDGLLPVMTSTGIPVMSMNLLLNSATDPVVWRGPMIGGVVEQFWTDVIWGDVDYMFVDMPPGTGDVPLTVFQSLPVSGIIIVTSPQELVGVIVEKAVKMAQLMNIPVLGLVENMAYFECPDCGNRHYIYGESRVEDTAEMHGIPVTASLPINPALAAACDAGLIETVSGDWLNALADSIEKM